jgi:hypothetical protein
MSREMNIEDLTQPSTQHYHRKRLPIVAVLRGLGSQENMGEDGDVMCAAADLISHLWELAEQAPELNMSNYDQDQVATLNATMIEIANTLHDATQLQHPSQLQQAAPPKEGGPEKVAAVIKAAVAYRRALEQASHRAGAFDPKYWSALCDALDAITLSAAGCAE